MGSKIRRARPSLTLLPLSAILVLAPLWQLAPLAVSPPLARADGTPGLHGAAASDNEMSSKVALDVLNRGGSVVDAAIAATFMLNVTAPMSCGIGGGGFALVYEAAEKRTTILDFRETAPAMYDEVAGLVELHRRWGRRSFAEDVTPAARAADLGFPLTAHMAKGVAAFAGVLKSVPGLGPIFLAADTPAKANDMIRSQALGRTLTRIGAEGSKAFYQGAVASEMVRVVRAAGGTMTEQDLSGYLAVERQPLRGKWEGYEIATMPPPSGGGLMLLETMGIFSKAELLRMGEGTANFQHMMAEAMRGALADRMRTVGDPAFTPDKSAALLAPAALAARRAMISFDRTHAPTRFTLPERGTSQLVVSDSKGNVVSLTTTINGPFGAGVFAPESGVILNNELEDFTSAENAARFGLGKDAPNAPRPNARPASSMMPSLVLYEGVPVLATGGSGGLRIANNVTEAVLFRLAFDKSALEAVSVPRFFTPPNGPIIAYGPQELPTLGVQLDLMDRGEQIKAMSWDETAVQMVTFDAKDGNIALQAAADPRKGGVALVK
jgi:gamma-glutamyltranspeptidase/glutathione hydrolase